MDPSFFETPLLFRNWLKKNHKTSKELLVGFYKVGSGNKSMSWPESVDEALSFGWIDGIRKSVDEVSYTIRFTPRKPSSIWSAVNIKKVADLISKGLMQPAGLEAFEKRSEAKSKIYSFENESKILPPEFMKKFKADKKAWKFFTAQAPSYQKIMIHWIVSAKQAATQQVRLDKTIAISNAQQRMQ